MKFPVFRKNATPQPRPQGKLRITYNSPVVLSFAGLCLIATLLGYLTGGGSDRLLFSTYRAPMGDLMMYPRLFLHVLGHANWEHFINNMMYLLILGPMMEEKYGSKAMILLILVTALMTGIVNNLLFPYTMLLGASGVIFALILLSSLTGLRERSLPLTFILVAVLYLGEQIISAVTVRENISYMAHILGGATGAGLGFWLQKKHPMRGKGGYEH